MKIFRKPVKYLFALQIAFFSLAACADWGSTESSNLDNIRDNVSDIKSYVSNNRDYLYSIDDTLSTKLLSIYETLYQYTQYVYSNPLWNSTNINTVVDGDNSYSNVALQTGGHTSVNPSLLDNSIDRIMPANMNYNDVNGSWSILFGKVQDRTYNYTNFLVNIKQQIGGAVDDFIDSWNSSSHFVQIYNYNNETVNGVPNTGAVSESDLAIAQKNINKPMQLVTNAETWFRNYQPDNDVLFTLDFSSLGHALSRLTGSANRWTDFQVEISLNPTEQRPMLKKAHETWNKFFVDKKGWIMIDMCLVLITLLWLWNIFKSVLQMD